MQRGLTLGPGGQGAKMARGFNYAPGASAEVAEAIQPALDKARVLELGASRNTLVRVGIAGRDDCPWGLMVTLAHDYSAEVRAAVARNPRAQRTVMAYLSADRSGDVVTALLENPALPRDLVEELAFHRKSAVRAAAAARLDAGGTFVTSPEEEDAHTPELAEHVAPLPTQMTADGMVIPQLAPLNVVDIATGEPVPTQPVPTQPPPMVTFAPVQAAPSGSEPAPASVPQIFTPHSTPNAPAPTRTAPVRGFKVRD
ncbi:hypothetical protein [Demequina sp.]|uniref:hypothetical protein n=1 Tax=Demequina sp. TaxID=2050685 RepID=UPI003D09BDBC